MNVPPLAFLGFCERAGAVRDGRISKLNILGLKQFVFSFLFPTDLAGLSMIFTMHESVRSEPIMLRVLDEANQQVGQFAISMQSYGDVASSEPTVALPDESPGLGQPPLSILNTGRWFTGVLPASSLRMMLLKPALYAVVASVDGAEIPVGGFYLGEAEAPQITPEWVAAVKADPSASKVVRYQLGCSECASKVRAYAAFGPIDAEEREGFAWYRDIAPRFTCACGKTDIDVSSVRTNLHGLLGQHVLNSFGGYAPLYERAAVPTLLDEFATLVRNARDEESVQKFIEANPLILHLFAPEALFFKPPLLTHRHADFAILTSQGELILVEIERPNLRLLKKDGGIAAELTHAFDQAREWLQIASDHRAAVLDCIGLRPEQVSSIAGVVIAGCDDAWPAAHLRRLKGTDMGRIRFFTYDDIQASIAALSRHLASM